MAKREDDGPPARRRLDLSDEEIESRWGEIVPSLWVGRLERDVPTAIWDRLCSDYQSLGQRRTTGASRSSKT